MKQLKKIFVSFIGVVGANIAKIGLLFSYGAFDPSNISPSNAILYGVPPIKETNKNLYVISAITFIIGLFVLFNKKIEKKIKALIIVGIVILAIASVLFFNWNLISYI